jgi:signal peptidase I
VVQAFKIPTGSMENNLLVGDHLLVNKFIFAPTAAAVETSLLPIEPIRRGEVIVFKFPQDPERDFIKRVIGLPGETVRLENGSVFVTQPGGVEVRIDEPYLVTGTDGRPAPTLPRDAAGTTEWVVRDGEYFVMGDNRPESQDSRFFGPIERDLIVGRAFVRYFPLDRITLFEAPEYPGLDDLEGARARAPGLRVPTLQPADGSSATIQASISRW